MNVFEQLNIMKRNIANVYDPALLFVMNKRYNELKAEVEKIKNITVYICQN